MYKFILKLAFVIIGIYLLLQIPYFKSIGESVKKDFFEKVGNVIAEVDRIRGKVDETTTAVNEIKDKVNETKNTVNNALTKVGNAVNTVESAFDKEEKLPSSETQPNTDTGGDTAKTPDPPENSTTNPAK